MSDSYTLVYFNKRGGGEIIRLVFAAAGVEYEDKRLEMEDWLKKKNDMPMKSLPCLQVTRETGTITYCQSGAIAKYLARKYDLYSESAEENLLIEEIYDSVGDVRKELVQIHFCNDENTKKDMQQKLTNETIPKFVDLFTLRKDEFGKDGFIIGSKLTLADLGVFNMVDSCTEMGLGSLWQPHEDLVKHREKIMKLSNISSWLETRPKTAV